MERDARWNAVRCRLEETKYSWVMRPVLNDDALNAFQDEWHVMLPDDYIEFLQKFGNGGPGPYYGIFPLEASTLREPDQYIPGRIMPTDVGNVDAHLLETDFPLSDDSVIDAALLEAAGISSGRVPGSIAISNYGCGGIIRLIVSGNRKGSVWLDLTFDNQGLHRQSESFLSWYEQWLSGDLPTLWKLNDFMLKEFP